MQGCRKQEIADGFKKRQGYFLDSSHLRAKGDNKITCCGVLTEYSRNQRELSSSTPTRIKQMVGCSVCVSWLPSESSVTCWERGRSWSGTVNPPHCISCGGRSLHLQKCKRPVSHYLALTTESWEDLQEKRGAVVQSCCRSPSCFLSLTSVLKRYFHPVICWVKRLDEYHCPCCPQPVGGVRVLQYQRPIWKCVLVFWCFVKPSHKQQSSGLEICWECPVLVLLLLALLDCRTG